MPSISLVIAAYNEAASLRNVFERSLAVLKQCTDDFEIIILDDASTDDTAQIAESLRQEHPEFVHVLTHATNQGIAVTFEELLQAATKEQVFDVPADGEYPPEALLEIVPMLDEYDIVICNRRVKEYTAYRRIVSKMYRLLPKILFGVELYDPGSTKCRIRTVIAEIPVTSKGVFVEAERLIRAARRGFRIGKVDIDPERRIAGDPRGAKFSNVVQAVRDVFCLWIRLVVLRQKP